MTRFFLIIALVLAGCQSTFNAPPVTPAQARLIANPTPEILEQVEAFLPGFLAEDIALERVAFEIGRPLTAREQEWARLAGVARPDKIRIAVVPRIPSRNRQAEIERQAGLAATTRAIAAGYGIIFAAGHDDKLSVLMHEFIHVRQFEQLGREGLARQVLIERAVLTGITVIPIEQEAVLDSAQILGIEPPYYPY